MSQDTLRDKAVHMLHRLSLASENVQRKNRTKGEEKMTADK